MIDLAFDFLTWAATGGNAFKLLGGIVLAVCWGCAARMLVESGTKPWR